MQWIAADCPGTLVMELYSNGQLFYTSQEFGGSSVPFFGGIRADEPIDKVRLFRSEVDFTAIDGLFFGPPIPAPGALAPFALALCGRRSRQWTQWAVAASAVQWRQAFSIRVWP